MLDEGSDDESFREAGARSNVDRRVLEASRINKFRARESEAIIICAYRARGELDAIAFDLLSPSMASRGNDRTMPKVRENVSSPVPIFFRASVRAIRPLDSPDRFAFQ